MPPTSLIHRVRPASVGTAPYPALLLLHGLGSNEDDLFMLASQIDPRFTAISARAPQPYQWGGYMWWNIDQESAGLGGPGIEASIGLLDRFLTEVIAAYDLDPARIYAGGFSQGAAMAGAYALLNPDRVAGAIMASGFLPPDSDGRYRTAEAAGHPFFQAHGTADPVVSITYARMTRDFLETTPVDLTYREYPMGHEVSLDEMLDLQRWLDGVVPPE